MKIIRGNEPCSLVWRINTYEVEKLRKQILTRKKDNKNYRVDVDSKNNLMAANSDLRRNFFYLFSYSSENEIVFDTEKKRISLLLDEKTTYYILSLTSSSTGSFLTNVEASGVNEYEGRQKLVIIKD